MTTFHQAQVGYAKARLAADNQIDEARESAIEAVDRSLDAFLAAPSRSIGAFADKLRALEAEYGCEWQPRHVKALIADLGIFAS